MNTDTDSSTTDDEATDTTTDADSTGRDVRVIGHRGCADQYPENTVHAIEQSAPHVDMIEIDVQRCGSGELVVFHDDDLDRLTGASGSVSTTDWADLRELTVLDSGEPIPLLTDVLDALPADTGLNIELKHDGLAEQLRALTEGVENELLFSSFSATALRELRELDPAAALALVIHDSPDINRSIAADLGCVAIHPSTEMVLESSFVRDAHDDGFLVNTWTIDDASQARAVIDAGVDGLFVDRWDIV